MFFIRIVFIKESLLGKKTAQVWQSSMTSLIMLIANPWTVFRIVFRTMPVFHQCLAPSWLASMIRKGNTGPCRYEFSARASITYSPAFPFKPSKGPTCMRDLAGFADARGRAVSVSSSEIICVRLRGLQTKINTSAVTRPTNSKRLASTLTRSTTHLA